MITNVISTGPSEFLMLFPLENQVQGWKIKRNLECTQFPGHEGAVVGVAFPSGEEEAVFTAGLDGKIHCWDDYDAR